MTVIIIDNNSVAKGGTAQVALSSAVGLAQKGINVVFISADGENGELNKYECIRHIDIKQNELGSDSDYIRGAINGIWNRDVYKKCSNILKEYDEKDTIIHIHGYLHRFSPSILKACEMSGIKTVVTIHDGFILCPNGGFYNYQQRKVCTLKPMSSKCIICDCDKRNYIQKIWRVIRQHNIKKYLMNNTKIDLIYISKRNFTRMSEYLDENRKVFFVRNPYDIRNSNYLNAENNMDYVYVGRISDEKGVDVFCEAYSRLKRQGMIRGKAIIVGDGEYKSLLCQKYSDIVFTGWKNHDEIENIMESTRVLVFPSRCFEGAPLTPIEFMARGIPCISSDICSATEYFSNQKDGLVFKSNDVEDLMDKLLMVEDDVVWSRITSNLRKIFCRDVYSLETHIAELVKVYENILNSDDN